jgi:hypothetical protein
MAEKYGNYVTKMALGRWDEKYILDYRPVNERQKDGKFYGPYGLPINLDNSPRRPFKIFKTFDLYENEYTYIMYDDDTNGDVAIYYVEHIVKEPANSAPMETE